MFALSSSQDQTYKSENLVYNSLSEDHNEIRLLAILPDYHGQQVRCTMSTVRLADAPRFIALSYEWGDAAVSKTIEVNECDVQVRMNLEAALRAIRSRGVPDIIERGSLWDHMPEPDCRPGFIYTSPGVAEELWDGVYWRDVSDSQAMYLWADAICINQQDDQEKSHQVGLMGKIYTSADLVLSWLGLQETTITSIALETIRKCGAITAFTLMSYHGKDMTSIMEVLDQSNSSLAEGEAQTLFTFTSNSEALCSTEKTQYPSTELTDFPSVGNKRWDAIRTLAEMGYFSRAWAQQEIALAKASVFFDGVEHVRMIDLDFFMTWVRQASNRILRTAPVNNVDPTLWFLFPNFLNGCRASPLSQALVLRRCALAPQSQGDGGSLWLYLIPSMIKTKATDPRDSVYAFLGLLSETQLRPDYTKDKSQVYAEWMEEIIRLGGVLPYNLATMLGGVGFDPSESGEASPSWIPDLGSDHTSAAYQSSLRFLPRESWSPAISKWLPLLPWLHPSVQGSSTLLLHGAEVARVAHLGMVNLLGLDIDSRSKLLCFITANFDRMITRLSDQECQRTYTTNFDALMEILLPDGATSDDFWDLLSVPGNGITEDIWTTTKSLWAIPSGQSLWQTYKCVMRSSVYFGENKSANDHWQEIEANGLCNSDADRDKMPFHEPESGESSIDDNHGAEYEIPMEGLSYSSRDRHERIPDGVYTRNLRSRMLAAFKTFHGSSEVWEKYISARRTSMSTSTSRSKPERLDGGRQSPVLEDSEVIERFGFEFLARTGGPDNIMYFFTASGGLLGVGPAGILPGDKAFVVPGLLTLLVLRPRGDGKWIQVGPCKIPELNKAWVDREVTEGRLEPSLLEVV